MRVATQQLASFRTEGARIGTALTTARLISFQAKAKESVALVGEAQSVASVAVAARAGQQFTSAVLPAHNLHLKESQRRASASLKIRKVVV